jgi:hypothetical protein
MTTGIPEVPPDHFSARAEPGFRRDQRSIAAKRLVPRKNIEFPRNKTSLLLRRHSRGPSVLRLCREATKLRPRCLIDVDDDNNGE